MLLVKLLIYYCTSPLKRICLGMHRITSAILSPVNVYNRKYTSQNSRRITSATHARSFPVLLSSCSLCSILSVDTNGAPRPHRLCRPCIRASGPLDHGRSTAEDSHLECSRRRTDILQDRLNINGDRKLVGARGPRMRIAAASQSEHGRELFPSTVCFQSCGSEEQRRLREARVI